MLKSIELRSIYYSDLIGPSIFYSFRRIGKECQTEEEKITRLLDLMKSHHLPTYNHLRQVAEYAYFLAEKSGCSDDEKNLIYNGALLHDIGKLLLPISVLNRNSLDAIKREEKDFLNSHAQLGAFILREVGLNEDYAIMAELHGFGNAFYMPLTAEMLSIPYSLIPYISIADVLAASLDPSRPYQKTPAFEHIKDYIDQRFETGIFPHNLTGPFYELLEKIKSYSSTTPPSKSID